MRHHHLFAFITFLLAISALSIEAQVRCGLNGGICLAGRSFSEQTDYPRDESYRVGPSIGLIVDYHLTDFLSLRTYPRYIQKGAKSTLYLPVATEIATSTADYFETPILAAISPSASLPNSYIIAGPTFSFLLSAQGETQAGAERWTYDQESYTKSFEFGFEAGLGQSCDITSDLSLLAEITYSRGLTKVLDEPFSQSLRSYAFQFRLGVLYQL